MLFDQKERSDLTYKSHSEGHWEYLDRSGSQEARHVRDLLASWASVYPEAHRSELLSRIRSRDDAAFQASTFELLIFSILRMLHCDVEVHPAVPSSGGRPDFLVRTQSGDAVYVEATLASESSRKAQATTRRRNVILDAVDQLDSPDFLIGISIDSDSHIAPSGRRIRRALQRWIASLDYEATRAALEANQPNPFSTFLWEDGEWKIEFDAIPRRRDRRGAGQKAIGAIDGSARWGVAHLAIREAVRSKGNRYGSLPHPLLVAVNVDAISVDADDEVGALFGDEQYLVRMQDLSAVPQMRRAANGAWSGPNGPLYTRVSGAWIFRKAMLWNLASCAHTLYFNPFAANALPSLFNALPHCKASDDKLRWIPGVALRDIFNLSTNWPEMEQ